MVTKGLNKITQNETQDLQLVDNFCKSWVRKAMDKNKEVPHHSVKTIIEDLEGITEIAFADSFVTIKPISKTQKKCLKLFNTSEPVSRYVQNIAVPNMIKYARKPHGDKGAK